MHGRKVYSVNCLTDDAIQFTIVWRLDRGVPRCVRSCCLLHGMESYPVACHVIEVRNETIFSNRRFKHQDITA